MVAGPRDRGAAQRHPKLRTEALRLYESAPSGTGQRLLEYVLQEIGGADAVLALVRGYARFGKPFDGSMHRALSKAVDEQQEPGTNVYNLHPVSVAPLRKALFAMLNDDEPRIAALAEECLANIDYLRDYMGPAVSEPRHPDIGSGRPWPRVAE